MSPSLQTMGFFMSDINFCNTKEQLNHLGEVVTGKVDGSPTGADIDTSTLPYTGQVRRTLPALESEYEQSITDKEAEADAAIDEYRLTNKGPYASGITLESKFEFITYNGESYFATNPPYTTTATAPDADVNLFVGGYVNESLATQIAETVLEENISTYTDIVYKSSGGNSAVENMIAGIPIESTPGNLSATAGYKIDGDGGEAKYVIKTASQASLDEDVIDGFINHALDNGNVAILMMGERLNAKQCGMVADAYNTSSLPSQNGDWNLNEEAILNPSYTDNSDALQAAIDYILRVPMRSPELYVPAGAYAVTRAALIDHADGLLINGAGKMSTMFVPVGDMTPILNTYFTEEQARLDAEFADPTDPGIKYNQEKAVFMISQGRRSGANYAGRWQKQTGNANWSLSFTNIGCSGGETSTGLSTSFIFAPEFAQSLISNVYVEKVHALLRTNDCYRMKLMQVEISDSFIPVDHFSTISEANARAANPEATSNATGTSISLDACGAHNLAYGWKFVHIPYSSFNAVAVDNWSEKTASTTAITSYAYDLERCAGLVLNGCGCEDFDDNKPSGIFNITGGDEGTTIINGGVYVHPGNPAGTTGEVFLLDGLSLELNSCTISSSAGIAINRGEVFIQGTSGTSLDSFRNKTAYVQVYDGMPISNSRFIPTINGVGKQKFSLFRVVQATQTVTPDLTNGYKVILDTNDSVRGFITQEYGAMMPSKDTIRIPYKGVFSVNISISHNALITNEINLIKESPEGVKTKMIKYVTDSASRGIGDKSFSITAPFGQYDLVYLEVPQIANPGTIYTVTTSVHQI